MLSGEVLGALDGRPVVVVDVESQPDAHVAFPPLLPCVTIGTSPAVRPAPDLDVLLTTAVQPPAPWVHVDDIDAAAQQLTEVAGAHPAAAVALVHVLRAGCADGPVEHDLLLESLAYSTLQAGPDHAGWLAARPGRAPRAPQDAPPVLVERDGDVLTITLNRPDVRNAYSAAMRDALCDALDLASHDPGLQGVHLRANGRDFSSGGDLDEFGTRPDPATAHLVRTTRSAARLLAGISIPVTAHLHGSCVGAGIELPALAARVLADPGTTIRLPEVGMGLIPGAGGTASLPRRIGRSRTAWLALSGARLDAATAQAWGLVDEVTPPS